MATSKHPYTRSEERAPVENPCTSVGKTRASLPHLHGHLPPFSSMEPRASYRALWRRVCRLPLDRRTLGNLQFRLRREYGSGKQPHRKRFLSYSALLDRFLVHEDFSVLEAILDYTYKPLDKRWAVFCGLGHLSLAEHWPTVHLISEIDSKGASEQSYQQAIRRQKPESFSIMQHLGLSLSKEEETRFLALSRLPSASQDLKTNMNQLMADVAQFYNFLHVNQAKVTHIKVPPFELVLETNRFGLPLSVVLRNSRLKLKVNQVKDFLRQYRPMEKEDLAHVIRLAIHRPLQNPQPELALNPAYFRFMARKHLREEKSLAPYIRKYNRNKKFVPSDNNLRKLLRGYVKKQFYVDPKTGYTMSWMQDFYETEPPPAIP